MEIIIDDELSGKERKHLLRTTPLLYALELFEGNRAQTARWLGISIRTLRNAIKEEPVLLEKYQTKKPSPESMRDDLEEKLPDEQRVLFRDEFEDMKSRSGWRLGNETRRKALKRRLILKHLEMVKKE